MSKPVEIQQQQVNGSTQPENEAPQVPKKRQYIKRQNPDKNKAKDQENNFKMPLNSPNLITMEDLSQIDTKRFELNSDMITYIAKLEYLVIKNTQKLIRERKLFSSILSNMAGYFDIKGISASSVEQYISSTIGQVEEDLDEELDMLDWFKFIEQKKKEREQYLANMEEKKKEAQSQPNGKSKKQQKTLDQQVNLVGVGEESSGKKSESILAQQKQDKKKNKELKKKQKEDEKILQQQQQLQYQQQAFYQAQLPQQRNYMGFTNQSVEIDPKFKKKKKNNNNSGSSSNAITETQEGQNLTQQQFQYYQQQQQQQQIQNPTLQQQLYAYSNPAMYQQQMQMQMMQQQYQQSQLEQLQKKERSNQ